MSEQVTHILRAMAVNYLRADVFDTLDSDALNKAADQIDALHAEAEALRAENGRLNAQFNECARLFVDATEQACKAQRVRDALAVELEAARGLLQHLASVMAGHDQAPEEYNALAAARDFTATPAPEVRAEQEERQEAVAWLHQVVCGDGEPDQALSFSPDNFPLAGTLGFRSIGHQPLYTAPQPSQDVRALVRAGQQMANSCYNLSQFEIIGDTDLKSRLRDLARGWDETLAAHRQAQRK